MPKTFSKEERSSIDRRLREEAALCLANYGVKGTTVDELVRRVKIPKGTFYLFYPSKEILLFQVLLDLHELAEKELIRSISAIANKRDVEAVTDAILALYKLTYESGLLRLMNSTEVSLIYRKLTPELLEKHLDQDDNQIKIIFNLLNLSYTALDISYYSSAFRILFLSMLNKQELGEEYAFFALRLCIRGLIMQMFE